MSLVTCWIIAIGSFFNSYAQTQKGISWDELNSAKKGTLPVFWYESRPFIFRNEQGMLTGIEYDLINHFASFVKKEYGLEVEIDWIEAQGFTNVMTQVVQSTSPCFGVSAFSKTSERKELVDFSPTYMSDIVVLISNKNVPMTENAEEFKAVFSTLTAITIPGTTYEMELLALQKSQNMAFKIEYISSALNILEAVEVKENSFGFIDLPIYLMFYSNNPSISVKRQNFYPVKREGYSFLIPKGSDWAEPVSAFFNQNSFQGELEKIIGKYLNLELYHLNERLALQPNPQEELLIKEKEFQYRNLLDKVKEIETRTRTNYVLTALVILAIMFSVIIVIQFLKRNQQRLKIAAQQEKIELANRQLEQRNQHLVALNEEKNNLIKILAHDMRQPLSQIEGLSRLLMTPTAGDVSDQKELLQHITDASQRLSRMITNILNVDAIESKRIEFIAGNIEVAPLVKKVIADFVPIAMKKNITIQLENSGEELAIKVDPLYLTQIMENLMSNAIKFSPKDKAVSVNIYQVNDNVRIAVRDEGPGISEEDKEKLFRKFQKLTARPTGGESSIGLGLAIVKKYVELMGGKVWCKSEVGNGATFLIEFAIGH